MFCLHVCLCTVCVPGVWRGPRTLVRFPKIRLRWLWAAMWMLGMHPGPSGRAASVPTAEPPLQPGMYILNILVSLWISVTWQKTSLGFVTSAHTWHVPELCLKCQKCCSLQIYPLCKEMAVRFCLKNGFCLNMFFKCSKEGEKKTKSLRKKNPITRPLEDGNVSLAEVRRAAAVCPCPCGFGAGWGGQWRRLPK